MLTHQLSNNFDKNFRFKVEYGCSLLSCDEKDCIGSEQNKYCFPVDRSGDSDAVSGGELLK